MELFQKLEKACLTKGQPEQSMNFLAGQLRKFCAHVQREAFLGAKQVTLQDLWGGRVSKFQRFYSVGNDGRVHFLGYLSTGAEVTLSRYVTNMSQIWRTGPIVVCNTEC
jgi:hypothetical protein